MKLIKPNVELFNQKFDIEALTKAACPEQTADILLTDMLKHIERCGRVCYKTEDKITDTSHVAFVEMLKERKHYAMLEHGTLYFRFTHGDITHMDEEATAAFGRVANSKYSAENVDWTIPDEPVDYLTTNYRVIVENNAECLLKYATLPHTQHHQRVTAHFVCNRQVSHEFVRHRVFSFAQESTRFCNYSLGKFGGELTFIEPCWIDTPDNRYDVPEDVAVLTEQLMSVEKSYFELLNKGWKPQQAATVLPNALKTELVMTGYLNDWSHFFDLRYFGKTGAPHPQAKELADKLFHLMYDEK